MQIDKVLQGVECVRRSGAVVDVTSVEYDSRRVGPGSLFVAMQGETTDGNRYIAKAIPQGAIAVVTDSPSAFNGLTLNHPAIAAVQVSHGRDALALIAANFFGHPERQLALSGVTGTNGKTTTAFLLDAMLNGVGRKTVLVGTIEYHVAGALRPSPHTTPESRDLLELFREGVDAGATEAVMEVSSHALAQGRVYGLPFDVAIFTNLTRDHLDYHRDMAAYFAAKRRLFTDLLPPDGTAIINLDSAEGRELAASCHASGQRVIGFGRARRADIRLVEALPDASGQRIVVDAAGLRRTLHLPLLGEFQAMNALAAVGLAAATGVNVAAALEALPTLEGAPGRMARVAQHPNGAPVIVDYAHTPDALETVLAALRPHCRGRLIVAFGCGGDRDPGKRPMMGEIAARRADIVIVTDDNPRSEDAASIRRAILAACPGAREIGDRAHAIAEALALLESGDLLLLAGKGHESGQIVGSTVLPFDDAEVARAAVASLQRRPS